MMFVFIFEILAMLASSHAQSATFALSSGAAHTCAIDREGVKCWGSNEYGQSKVPQGLVKPSEVGAGWDHTCAIDLSGVKCWGNNSNSQLAVPSNLKNPRGLSVNRGHACVIDDDGVKCWGNNYYGEMNIPQNLKKPRQVATGWDHVCALDDDGVKCWGYLGPQIRVPKKLKNPRQISAGAKHTCALDDNGMECWGFTYNKGWEVHNSFNYQNNKIEIPLALNEALIMPTTTTGHTICGLGDEQALCWSSYDIKFGESKVPADLKNPRLIAPGPTHTCALDDDGVKCWGKDWYGSTKVPANLKF